MKKLLFIILLLPFAVQAQTTYQLNYDSIRVNKTSGLGGTSLYGKVYLKNVGLGLVSDSILTVLNGRIRKIPIAGLNLWSRSGGTLSPINTNDSVNIGTGLYRGHGARSDASDGFLIEASNGTDVGRFGVANTANASLFGGLTVTGAVSSASLSAASASITASNGISGGFSNNATSFETLRATNNGSGLIASFRNSGGEVASIGNSGIITLADEAYSSSWNGKLEAPTKNAIWDSGFLTSSSGVVLTTTNQNVGGIKTFTDSLLVVRANDNKLKVQATGASAGAYIDIHRGDVNGAALLRYYNKNNPSYRWQVGLHQGNANKYMIQNATTGSLQDALQIDTLNNLTSIGNIISSKATGTNSFNSLLTGTDGHFSGSFGIGISPTFPFHVSKSVVSNYVAQLTNTNTTAGTSFGLFMNAGTNGSDRAINVNNAANTVTLLASFGNGDFEIGGSNATKASGTAWINPSDSRLKENIQPYAKGLKELLLINPKVWNYNKASGVKDTVSKHVSPIAQELAEVMPEMVGSYKGKLAGKETTLYNIDGSDYTMLLINAVKEQQAIIEKLNQRITVLESKP